MIKIGLTGWGDHPDVYSEVTSAKDKLFDYSGDILEDVAPGKDDWAEFETTTGEKWDVGFWSDSGLTIDKSLDLYR